jgi:hypothetical protein
MYKFPLILSREDFPMDEIRENRLFSSFEKCLKALNFAIKVFQDFLSDRTSSDPSNYYEAQKYLDESRLFYKEALQEVSALIGSIPADASPGFRKWKENFLKGTGIISESKEFEALKSELHNDRLLHGILTPEEIDTLLMKHYESQQTGKRILSNIKARMILDKIINLLDDAEALDKIAKEKLFQRR